MNKLQALAAEALKSLGEITFNIKDVQTRASKTGNVGYKAVTSEGKTITFWQSNMDKVVEAIDDDNFRVIPGTQVTEEGSLIPRDNVSGGFWS